MANAVNNAQQVPTPTAVKTAAYTAAVGELVPADAAPGGFTVTLPAAPASGSTIWVKKIDTTKNTVTVQRGNSTDVFNETNGPTLLQLAVAGESVQVQYRSGIWYVVAHSFAVPGLDSRYVRQGPSSVAGVYNIQDSNGANAISIIPAANALNNLAVYNSVAGSPILAAAVGLDENIDFEQRPKGTGSIIFKSGPGATLMRFSPANSAVNGWKFVSSSTGNPLSLQSEGNDANISINITPKGTGTLLVNSVNVLLTGGALGTPSSGTLTNCTFPTLNQNTTGNAATATKLATARTINGVSFDGTANITVVDSTKQNTSEKGVANGYASLDSGGKIPVAQLPSSIMEYQGTWDASTNSSPTLANGTGSAGDVYRVSVAGTALGLTFEVGDYIIYNGTTWEKSDTTDAVATVAGRTGHVTLTSTDVGLGNVDNTSNATERAATASLTNKDLTSATNTFPTLNQNTSGTAAGLSATLVVGSGGTGVTTLTGLVKGNGTSAMSAAVAGTDFIAPGGAAGTPSSLTLTNATGLPVSGITASTSTALGVGSIELGHASDTSLTRSAAGVLAVEGVDLVNLSSNQTLTTKTISAGTYTGAQVVASSSYFAFHNQTDRTTNFERCDLGFNSNQFVLNMTSGGTGARRPIVIQNGCTFTVDNFNSTSGTVRVSNATAGVGVAAFGVTSTYTNSSGLTYSALINPTMSQTGTGGYTTLLINTTETSNTGSGAKLLIDAQLAGSSKFSVSNAGSITLADAANLAVGTSTGTKIGTATTQKLGFWNASPAAQPTAVADATDAASVITQVNALLSRLRTIGLIAT
jgi:hypothetical protein